MELARATSERGELVLRHREDGALELRVNGVFVMDDQETSSEELLAAAALATVRHPDRVLVGGLGLGYTVRALLADERLGEVMVAEIEPDLVAWMRAGLVPSVLDDPRVAVVVGDVRAVVADLPGASVDAILLDVDNGPDFLVYNENSAIYTSDFLTTCHAKLRPGGVLTVWSSAASPALESAVKTVFSACDVKPVPVRLQGRDELYYVYQGSS
ncbi:MnmC family methyltransferase [Kribbella sp. GL6]|uniref:spermine/spermidine synthase domain-containing protein n=1 Tax=Kribbella sp. GL6 TaxID=3419765 RepID=UPI003D046B51